MRDSPLPFSPPDITEEEIDEVVDCLRSGWITTGPRVARLEKEFASYVGAEAALALSSGTAALHTALTVLGVGPGDRVVVPVMTFSSAAHVVEHSGASIAFVDSEPDSLNADLERVADALAAGASCLMPVHLYGRPCDVEGMGRLAGDRPVVDDAAHALPASAGGRMVGSIGTMTAFSFYATKNLTTAEGGMLTGPSDLIEEARVWSLHGMSVDAWMRYDEGGKWRYDVTRPGFKYNMSDLQAALGLVQLRRLDGMHARRGEIAARYTEGMRSMEELELPSAPDGITHAWHIYSIRLRLDRLSIDRDGFIRELSLRNIGTSVHFIPLHQLTYYRDRYELRPGDFPVATAEFERLISLPIHPGMSDGDVEDVVEAVSDVVGRYRS